MHCTSYLCHCVRSMSAIFNTQAQCSIISTAEAKPWRRSRFGSADFCQSALLRKLWTDFDDILWMHWARTGQGESGYIWVTINATYYRKRPVRWPSPLRYCIGCVIDRFFSKNFVKFLPTSIVLVAKMAKRIKLLEVNSLSTSSNSCQLTC